jgi:hypothetical protein
MPEEDLDNVVYKNIFYPGSTSSHKVYEAVIALVPMSISILWFCLWSFNDNFLALLEYLGFYNAFIWFPLSFTAVAILIIRLLCPARDVGSSVIKITFPTILIYPIAWFFFSSNSGPNGMAIMIPLHVFGGFMLTASVILSTLLSTYLGGLIRKIPSKNT